MIPNRICGFVVVLSCTILLGLPKLYAQASIPGHAASRFAAVDPSVQIKQMRRGVNILGYDPIWEDFAKRRVKQNYFKLLRAGGFNAVRVSLQAFAHMGSQHRLSPEWFKTLDWAVDRPWRAGCR